MRRLAEKRWPTERLSSPRPGHVSRGLPFATFLSFLARILAVLARRLRGRQARLGRLLQVLERRAEALESQAADERARARTAEAELDAVFGDLRRRHPGLASRETATERWLRRLVLVFELCAGLFLAGALNLEIRLDWSTSAIVETLKAVGLAGAVGFAMFVVGDALGRLGRVFDEAAWADGVRPELVERFPQLFVSKATRARRRAFRLAFVALALAVIAVRGLPALLDPAAMANPVIVAAAFLGGVVSIAPMIVGMYLGGLRGPASHVFVDAEHSAAATVASAERRERRAARVRGRAEGVRFRLVSEQSAMACEAAGIGALAGAGALAATGEDAETAEWVEQMLRELRVSEGAFPAPTLDRPAIPGPGRGRTPGWVPVVVPGGRTDRHDHIDRDHIDGEDDHVGGGAAS